MNTKEIVTSKEMSIMMQICQTLASLRLTCFVTFCIDTPISCCSAVGYGAEIMLPNTKTKLLIFFQIKKKGK